MDLPEVSVAPLTQARLDGTPYRRRADVEAQIRRALADDPSGWPAAATAAVDSGTRLSSEALIHLIRILRSRGERTVFGQLVQEVGKRIAGIAKSSAKGFDRTTTEEIVLKVGVDVVELILAETPTRQSEFLEVAFRLAVERRFLNEVESRKEDPRPHQFAAPTPDGAWSSGGSSHPAESVPDDGPSPEESAIEAEERRLAPEVLRRCLNAISDPRHREAVILHHLRGWPITDKDPSKPSLCSHFELSDRQIRKWMERSFTQMRGAMGDET
ncbi:RNA polymerase sigma factor [Tautonia sociabilis]|uniref:Sigma-70 family RNA polymerase sigma factor n=1 Tax=Tautonia sociabilis TaxID=2080755 RepID=A0A432MCH3_9BACT|nr:sigma-70 family RNA polymerase sigma factor [Tautonia sociabilis]RUL81892.1 sigma-70 family RNA polymerase sigma factor [Tautonia sociabilis]